MPSLSFHLNFMQAWAKLNQQERRQVESMITRINEGGITPGMRPHQIHGGNMSLLSLSPNMDIRVLGWQEGEKVILLHVDHHDEAYNWAEKNSLKIHAAEVILLSNSNLDSRSSIVDETNASSNIDVQTEFSRKLIHSLTESGVPRPLCKLLENVENENELFESLELVAPEWQELILEAVLGKVAKKKPQSNSNIWVSPDDSALKMALSLSHSLWRVFLHPSQREAVMAGLEKDLLFIGGPGTGKTVALVHRAVRLANACKSQQCVVLVGHSPQSLEAMSLMAKELAGSLPRSLHLTDMVSIGRRGRPQPTDVEAPLKQSGGYLRHLEKDVVALLIDEAQDIHKTTKNHIFRRHSEDHTHITLCLDFNQNIFADNRENDLLRFVREALPHYFTYSYRVPREAGLVAKILVDKSPRKEEHEVIRKFRNTASNMNFGFSSEFVKLCPYDNLKDGILEASHNKVQLLEEGNNNIGIIFCGNSKERKLFHESLKALGYNAETDSGLHTPRSVKGLEFDFCLVIAPELLKLIPICCRGQYNRG